MGPKRKLDKKTSTSAAAAAASRRATSPKPYSTSPGSSGGTTSGLPESAGYLVSCDIPTKQFIQHLNDEKGMDKKFIIAELDAKHLLVKTWAREEIDEKVERWMDSNVFSSVENVGESFDLS